MSAEKVIEISVSETNALRAELGLPPLRGATALGSGSSSSGAAAAASAANSSTTNDEGEILSLSVSETDALRLKLGLAPLKKSGETSAEGSSRSTAIHVKPHNATAEREAKRRIEDAAARRDAGVKIRKLERENDRGSAKGGESAADFAARLMTKKKNEGGADDGGAVKKKKGRRKDRKDKALSNCLSLPDDENDEYTSADLEGIKVSHEAADFLPRRP